MFSPTLRGRPGPPDAPAQGSSARRPFWVGRLVGRNHCALPVGGLPFISRLALVSLATALSGCWSHPVERRLTGRWLGEGVENVSAESLAAATGWAKGTSMEFAGTSVTIAIPAEEPRKGRFRVIGVADHEVELAVERNDGRSDQLLLQLDDENTMRWLLGRGRAVLLRRE